MGSELPTKVGEREERVRIIKTLLVFSVAAFDLAIVSGCIRSDQLMADAQGGGCGLKESLVAAILDRETIGELRAIIGLDALDFDAVKGIPGNSLSQEVS